MNKQLVNFHVKELYGYNDPFCLACQIYDRRGTFLFNKKFVHFGNNAKCGCCLGMFCTGPL